MNRELASHFLQGEGSHELHPMGAADPALDIASAILGRFMLGCGFGNSLLDKKEVTA